MENENARCFRSERIREDRHASSRPRPRWRPAAESRQPHTGPTRPDGGVPAPGPAFGVRRDGGRVLDLGCGTGRLTRALAQRSRAVGMDAASAMLAVARDQNGSDYIQGDAFGLPFAAASFDAVVALRLVFHFSRLEDLLQEMSRVVTPGGVLVFDTYLWSPRALMPLDQRRWGTQIYVHSPRAVEECARALGLRVLAREPSFLFSPYLYRRLPIRFVRMLARLESHLPERLHARVFWKIERQ